MSDSLAYSWIMVRSRAISANGLSVRCFRSRKRATASAFRASQARWKPPMPLIATIAPELISAAAASMASRRGSIGLCPPSGSSSQTFGPQTGQAFGWAWKRRLEGIAILGEAVRAHLERRHARRGAVIRNRPKNRKSRTAMGAIRERIAIAPVRRVADVGHAFGAGGGVGDDAGRNGATPARHDAEIRWRFARQRRRFDQIDPGEGRGLRRERDFELDDDRRMPESVNEHTLAVVPDVASQAEAFREPPHRWAEAYALHEAAHPDGYSFDLVYCVQPCPPNAPCKPCTDRRILQYAGPQWASFHLFVAERRQGLARKRRAFLARRPAKNSRLSARSCSSVRIMRRVSSWPVRRVAPRFSPAHIAQVSHEARRGTDQALSRLCSCSSGSG